MTCCFVNKVEMIIKKAMMNIGIEYFDFFSLIMREVKNADAT